MSKETVSLTVSLRETSTKPNSIRQAGSVPGVIYGDVKNTPIQCVGKDIYNVYVKAGENTLVEVDMEKKKVPCLIHAISFHPVSGSVEHFDLLAVDMKKKVTTHVPVVLTGESPAVKTMGGVLVTVHSQLEVTCLPADLPSKFTVDISKLENFRDSVTVAMLEVPKGVVIGEGPETMIVMVQEPRKEEVVVAAVAEGEAGAATAEGAEGAAAPGAEGAAAAAPVAGEKDKKEEKKKEEKKK